MLPNSFATVCFHDSFGLALRILVHGYSGCVLSPLPLKALPVHFHFLCFVIVATCSCPVLDHSSSFMMTFSRKMPSTGTWQNLFVLIGIGLQALDVKDGRDAVRGREYCYL